MASSLVNKNIIVINTIDKIRKQVKTLKSNNKTIGLVPTMGALHDGHASLIKKAAQECDEVVVSIFVNPTQFGLNEDLDKYPRQLKHDIEICKVNGASLIFAPSDKEIYPENKHLTYVVPSKYYQNKLCGLTRQGHFNGVATIVLKLFNIITPDQAFFGLKDAQQLIIIKKMCQDLNVPVKILECPIIRDTDGLALSSRNAYLTESGRFKATTVNKFLFKIKELYNSGLQNKEEILKIALKQLDATVKLEYLEFLSLESFSEIDLLEKNTLIAVAANVDNVRLIDNIVI